MRWPKKREFIAFYILSNRFSREIVSFHTLVTYLSEKLYYSNKVAKNIVKRLVSLGYITYIEDGYIVRDYREVLNELYLSLILKRVKQGVKR